MLLRFCRHAHLTTCPPALLPFCLIDILFPFLNILIHAADATFPFFLDKYCDWKSTPRTTTTATTTYLFLELWAELAAKIENYSIFDCISVINSFVNQFIFKVLHFYYCTVSYTTFFNMFSGIRIWKYVSITCVILLARE